MADTSTYAKMRDIVATVRSLRSCTIDQLTGELTRRAKRGFNGFVYYRKNEDGEIEVNPCKDSTMRRHVRFCQDLGLLGHEATIKLTNATRSATRLEDYQAMLESLLIEYLDKHKITVSALQRAIKQPGVRSDPETLYGAMEKTTLTEDNFRRCLNLLSIAGKIIIPYQKKMYIVRD